MDLGFEAAGFEVTTAVELAPYAAATLRAHFPGAKVLGPPDHPGDIRRLDASELPTEADVLIGGPPCQSFSIAAAQRFLKGDAKFKRIGFADRNRGSLVHDYLRILEALRPRVFVIENVPGLMDLDGGLQLKSLLVRARKAGYVIAKPTVFQAADYGVPQLRQRLIIIGVARKSAPSNPDGLIPKATHAPSSTLFAEPYKTVVEALARLPRNPANHLPREHQDSSIARYRRLRPGQREKLGRVDRLHPYRPSKTVIAGGSNGGGRSHLHPFLARTLTVRECARLQTFPDDFVFAGTMSRQFTQVGNAVPPLLAEHIARSIGSQIFGLEIPKELRFSINKRRLSLATCASDVMRYAVYEREEYLYLDLALDGELAS